MEEEKPKNNTTVWIVGIVIALCCICVIALPLGGYLYYQANPQVFANIPLTTVVDGATATPDATVTRPPLDSVSTETADILQTTIVPPNDARDLACRLEGKCDVPEVLATSATLRKVGETDKFWVSNQDTTENTQIQAKLMYITPHSYFWVQDGVQVDAAEVKALADTFENKIYPTDREFFGNEWTPGIDGDEHIYLLYARGLGGNIAGYFSSAASTNPLIHKFSNGHEMFLFNADNSPLSDLYTYSVLAHEFQHMIHWNQDLNETTWLNEGFSELAVLLNGYDPGGFDFLYISDPDLQLNDWPNDSSATTPHYGASFLFFTYFLDRFGEDATKAIVKDPANGLDSVDNALKEINATDAVTGQPITGDDFFLDWAVTNFLLDPSVGDGRYVYKSYTNANRASATETISTCPQSQLTRDVHQYGVDYIEIDCAGDYTLSFTGSTVTGLLPADPHSGQYAFWSNKGDKSNMRLTHEFDFTQASGDIKLTYNTWYDIEEDWDYVYLEVSEDGKTWQIIQTPSSTDTNPSGNSYGWGYTGVSNGWKEETVDLSQYAGKKIQVRFEYVTDDAVNGEGFLLDDVSVQATGYQSDFEADDGGWVAEGFARIQNTLPQTFKLALIRTNGNSVESIPLSADQTADIPLSLQAGDKAYLVVTGTSRFTRELATYQIEIK
ncbi:MAG: immune inhibitor A [Anaerolineales bacterium]